jgi:GNAT superfamily N-acetyltransferase
MQITLEDAPDPAIHQLLFQHIDQFNDHATGLLAPAQPLSLVLRDPQERAEGGLLGISYYGWLIVAQLYLPPALRGHRMGTLLLRLAETEAVRRGCRGIWLDTWSFQAKPFYERCGFAQFAELSAFPTGHRLHFMAKTDLKTYPAAPGVAASGTIRPEDQVAINQALTESNDAAIGPGPGPHGRFAVVARDAAGVVQGGLWARFGRRWMFVELLILPPALRGQGVGARMLAMAEAHARAQGCTDAWLDSFSFQAPGFYARQGWREFGRLDAYPAGHTRHFFTKRLSEGQACA